MQLLREMGGRLSIAWALIGFFWRAKMWWMIPMVVVLVFIGLVLFFATASGVGPFIYTLF